MKAKKAVFEVCISGSKSESNRALILQSYSPDIEILNLSDSDDTEYLKKAIIDLKKGKRLLDCGHAGTVLRFLLARLVFEPNFSGVLSGSQRLLSRPIQPLMDALKPFAKEIKLQQEGLSVISSGSAPKEAEFFIDANQSSQFISALCLCAPRFPAGIKINISGTLSSMPYIQMTLDFMNQLGYKHSFGNHLIQLFPTKNKQHSFVIEPDWSSLSYWFSAAVLSKTSIFLPHYREQSLQADAKILDFSTHFGVEYNFTSKGLELHPTLAVSDQAFLADFDACPDIAPTFMALCAGLNMPCQLTGLHSLKHKECDRIVVMHNNLKSLGYHSTIDNNSFSITDNNTPDYSQELKLVTDLDHRIAMSLAPLQLLFKNITFDDATVVSKSYKNFWKDMDLFKQHININ